MLDPSRASFFSESLHTLELASVNGFDSLRQTCTTELEAYQMFEVSANYSMMASRTINKHLCCDYYSKEIYPSDADTHLTPVRVYGDGNCLFRAMSLLLCGSQDLHVELRARAVCDMVLWKDFYTSGGAIPPQEVAPMEIVKKIAAICASFKEGQNLNDYHTVKKHFSR